MQRSSSIRSTLPLATPMRCHRGRPALDIPGMKRREWWDMPRPFSSSVRVIYPRFSRETLIEELRRGIPALAEAMPLREVTLFGSWAAGRATAFSDIDLLVIYADPEREDA